MQSELDPDSSNAAEQAEFDAFVLQDWHRQLDEQNGVGIPPPPAALSSTEQLNGGTTPNQTSGATGASQLHRDPMQEVEQPENTGTAEIEQDYQPAAHLTTPADAVPSIEPRERLRDNLFSQTIVHDLSTLQEL